MVTAVAFNVSKYKHLHFGAAYHHGDFYLNVDTTTTHRDLGIALDDLTFTQLMLPQKLIKFLDWLKDLLSILTLPC